MKDFLSQLGDNRKTPVANRLDMNITNFTTEIGMFSKRFFRMSFAYGGFYASGNKWAARTSKWGKKNSHSIMNDTGTLKNSIDHDIKVVSRQSGRKINGRTPFTKMGATYLISTKEETIINSDKKRGVNSHAIGYAAIHNTDPRLTNFKVNQYSNKKPVQRQFIGFNERLNDYIMAKYVPMIFKGLPL